MRQLDAEPERGVEDGLAGADIDFAVVDGEALGRRRLALARDLIHRRRMGDAGLTLAIVGAARGALLVVAITGGFLSVRVAHIINLRLAPA